MNAIEINSLSYRYQDGTNALNNVSIDIKKGSKVAILGANGSGKSTLLQHLNGLIMPQNGEIKILGRVINNSNIDEIRKWVGLLFDNPDNQLFSTTVYNDIAFGPTNLRLSKDEVKRRVDEAIRLVDIENLRHKSPCNLSLGQKKRAAIAGLLAMNPKILLMDEPFSGLDPISLNQFLKILKSLSDDGCTQLISTHDVDIAYWWADYIVIIQKGNIIAKGSAKLLEDKKLMEESGLVRPTIAEIFADTGMYPKTAKEGNRILIQEGVI